MSRIANKRLFYVPAGGARASMSSIDIKSRLGEAVYDWLYVKKHDTVKPATFMRLMTSYRLLVQYPVANYRLMDLKSADIQVYVKSLVSDGYSKSTIKKAYELVSAFLRYAVGEGLPISPLWVNVDLPTEEAVGKHKRDISSYDEHEQNMIRSACEKHSGLASFAVLLLLETGMRIGELLALDWSDVDWGRRAVHIHRTLVNPTSRKNARIQNSPKSRNSDRLVPLSSRALDVLRRIQTVTNASRGLVFSSDDANTTVAYNPLMDAVRLVLDEAGVPWYGFHAFRHTFATNCYHKGCDVKKLSKLLGHKDVRITYSTYIHLYGDCLKELRSIVE